MYFEDFINFSSTVQFPHARSGIKVELCAFENCFSFSLLNGMNYSVRNRRISDQFVHKI